MPLLGVVPNYVIPTTYNPVDEYAIVTGKFSPFNVNLGISRKLIPTSTLSLPNCSIKVYDKNNNEVECNGINEIIMGGRCFSGPVISKEVWERMKVKWPDEYGYTPTGSFGEWVQSVPNFDVVDPQSNLTIRQQFYKILKTYGLYDIPTGIPPYSTEIVHSDEERYLEYAINPAENPYITLEDLRDRIPFEQCYDLLVPPTFDSIGLPCFSSGCENIILGATPKTCIFELASVAGINIDCSNLNDVDYITLAQQFNNISAGCLTANQVRQIISDICQSDPEFNKCKFKYNNKFYREKEL